MNSREALVAADRGSQIPDYENYDFYSVWLGRGIADAAERMLVYRWARPGESRAST